MTSFPVIAGIHNQHYLRLSMPDNISPRDYEISAPDVVCFKDVHTMVLVSFFPGSGSSLLGYLLTAHPNMVVAYEPDQQEKSLYDEVSVPVLLNHILSTDKIRLEDAAKVQSFEALKKASNLYNLARRTYTEQERYVYVPNQWQARYESLEVIGVKNSLPLVESLLAEGRLQRLRESLQKARIHHLRFIFTVRNPYDMIATNVLYWAENKRVRMVTKDDISKMLDYQIKVSFPTMCERGEILFKLMKPGNILNQTTDILINKHEDLVASPVEELSKLCEFLKVPALPDYLDDCASVVDKYPNPSRHELNWLNLQKQKVAELIDKYHFLSGYSWDS